MIMLNFTRCQKVLKLKYQTSNKMVRKLTENNI